MHRRAFQGTVVYGVACVVVAVLVLWAHVWRLDSLPPGLAFDEAAIGWNAWSLNLTGRDETGTAMPMFVSSIGAWHDPVMVYTVGAFERVLGLTIQAVRLPSALFHCLAALAVGLLAQQLTRRRWVALGTALAFGLASWGFVLSRSTMGGYSVMLAGMAGGWWLLTVAVRTRGWRPAVGAALCWALAMYGHHTARPMAALWLLLFVAAYGKTLLPRWRTAALFGGLLAVLMAPVVYLVLSGHPALTERFGTLSIWSDGAGFGTVAGRFFGRWLEYYSPHFLLFAGDENMRHHTGYGGMLSKPIVALAVVGIIVSLRHWRRRPDLRFLLLTLLTFPVAAALTMDHYHSTRSLNGVLPIVLLAAIGAAALLRAGRSATMRRALVAIAVVAWAVDTTLYMQDYVHAYPVRARGAFATMHREIFTDAFNMAGSEVPVYISTTTFMTHLTDDFRRRRYALLLFFGAIAPARYQTNGLPPDRVRWLWQYTGGPGILIRSNVIPVLDPGGETWRFALSPEPVPPGAIMLSHVPISAWDVSIFPGFVAPGSYDEGLPELPALELYRLPATPPPAAAPAAPANSPEPVPTDSTLPPASTPN